MERNSVHRKLQEVDIDSEPTRILGRFHNDNNNMIFQCDADDEDMMSSPETDEIHPLVPRTHELEPSQILIVPGPLRQSVIGHCTQVTKAPEVMIPTQPKANSDSCAMLFVPMPEQERELGHFDYNSSILNNGKSMVAIRLSNDEDAYSSSSPFHSATEEVGNEHENEKEAHRDRDCDPLIRPPARQGAFHHILTSKILRNKAAAASADHYSRHFSNSTRNGKGHSRLMFRKRQCSVGIFLAAISCIFFATSALIVKVSELHPMELLGVRGLLQGIFVAPLVISTQNSFLGPAGSRSLLMSRAVLGAVALVMSFASIHLIPLADAATVIFTSPVFVSIFACICLGELCTWFDVAMISLTLVGVLLVSKPSFGFLSSGSWTSIVGTGCGLAAAMLTALAFIVLRQLKHVHYSVTVFWFSTVLTAFGAVLTIALDGFTIPNDWRSLLECGGIGICGFLGQILLTKALQIENAGPVAVARTMDIVLAFFYQITLLHDTPDWYSYFGSVLVVSCVLLTAFSRWYKDSIPENTNNEELESNLTIENVPCT